MKEKDNKGIRILVLVMFIIFGVRILLSVVFDAEILTDTFILFFIVVLVIMVFKEIIIPIYQKKK